MNEGEISFSDRYRIVWQSKSDSEVQGEVRNYATTGSMYRRVPIRMGDDELKQIRMRFLALVYREMEPEIVVSSVFMTLPRTQREVGIWHEVGHVHHEHLFLSHFDEARRTDSREARWAASRRGAVLEIELEADRFAVQRSSQASVIAFLDWLLQSRPRSESGAPGGVNDLGRHELELRIAAIARLES